MDPEKTKEEKEKKQHDRRNSPWRRSVVPLSLSLRSRSPTKRESIINVIDDPEPEPEPICQEKAHYPVFNAQDPRHNPSAEPRFWRRHDSQTSSSEAQKQCTSWVQDLPRRSLHKARSGILALRAGLMRRSIRPGSESDDASPESPQPPEPQEEKRGHGEQGMSDTSTQADSSMGVRLYRTSTPWPSSSTEGSSEAPTQNACAYDMTEMVPASEALVSYDDLHDSRPAAAYPVKASSDEPPAYCVNYNRAPAQRSPKYLQTVGAGHRYTWERSGESSSQHTDEDSHRPHDSTILQTTAFLQGSARQSNEENAGPCGLWNSNRTFSRRQDQVPAVHGGSLVVSEVCSSHGRRLSSHLEDTSDIRSVTVDQDTATASAESFSLPDPDAPRFTGTNRSNQQIAGIRRSEALVTQERLQTYNEPHSPETGDCSHSQSANSSAKVDIPFPQTYHELVELWQNEIDQKRKKLQTYNEPHSPETRDYSYSQSTNSSARIEVPFPETYQELVELWQNEIDQKRIRKEGRQRASVSPQRPMSQIPLQQNLAMQPGVSTKLSPCREEHHQMGDTHAPHHQARNVISMYALKQPTVLNAGNASLGTPRASRFISCASNRSPQGMAHSHPPTEHTFGLHISLEKGTAERDGTRERHQRAFQGQPVHQQTLPNDQWVVSSVGLFPAFDESSSSSSFTQNSIFSAGANSVSTPNTAWSPLDSPIDEEVLFSDNWRNEYWMADGKTSGYYPGRGDQPLKAMWRRAEADGRLCNGSGMYWAPSNRVPLASELVVPTRASRPSRLSSQEGRGREQETVDDYFQRFPAQARRLGG